MDFRHRAVNFNLLKNIFARLPSLQIRSFKAKPNPQTLKLLRGLTLIFFSLLFAWIAETASFENAWSRFLNQEWPPRLAWNATLNHFRLIHQSKGEHYSSLLLNHPQAFSQESTLWVSEDGCVVFIPQSPFVSKKDSLPSELWAELWTCSLDPKLKVKEWISLGSGIKAFAELIQFLEKIPKKQISVSLRRNAVDPKEIRY